MTQFSVDQAMKLAIQNHQAGRLAQAREIYRGVLVQQPNHPDSLHMLGVIAHQTGHLDAAIELIQRAIRLKPESAEAHYNLGNVLGEAGRFDEAISTLRHAIQLKPGYAEAYNNLGNLLREIRQLDEAAAVLKHAVQLKPDLPEAHNNLGNVLRDKGLLEDAIAAHIQALRLKPDFASAYHSLGCVLQELGKWPEALENHRKAVALEPANPALHWSYSRVLLLLGQWKEGWAEFESRLNAPRLRLNRDFSQPKWDGLDSSGETILLHAEGGYGDALNFIRFVPQVAKRGARLILECQSDLVSLFQGLPGLDRVLSRGQPLPPFDQHIPLQSLPRVFGLTLENIPNTVPYLAAPPDRVSRWASRLADETKLRIGLVWSGSKCAGPDNRTRSIDVFVPLAEIPGIKFFSLQKGDDSSQLPPAGMDFADFSTELNDFADTAALVQNLDLVVTVDTAVAHLAGALAKPVWVLIPLQPDFRWLLDRTDSPWYPTMRLFRQKSRKDWAEVVDRIAQALDALRKERR
jgi:tetratricopeptide (TPR) repeat protein